MPYGTLKADTLTYYTATGDVNLAISGIALNGAAVVSGVSGIFTTVVSGATVTGNAGQFTTITGGTVNFANITGVSGTFTTRLSGATVTGNTAQFTTATAVTGVFTTSISGATVTGDLGLFNTISGNQVVLATGLSIPSGSASSPSISVNGDPNTGLYSPGADQVAISTNGTGRITIDASGNVNIDSNTLYVDATSNRVGINTIPGVAFDVAGASRFDHTAVDALSLLRGGVKVGDIGGSAGGGTFSFRSAPSTPISFSIFSSEVARIDSSGRLGLGTSSPSSALSIDGASALGNLGSGAPIITLKNTDTSNFNTAQIVNRDSGGNLAGGITFRNDSHGASGTTSLLCFTRTGGTNREALGITSGGTTTLNAAASNAPFIAQINSTEVARIDSSGRLLTGTSSVINVGTLNQAIQIAGTGGPGNLTVSRYTNDVTGSLIGIGKSRSTTVGGFGIVSADDNLGQYSFYGADGAAFIEAARVSANVDGTPGANDMPGRLVFSTTADGASSPTERMRITNAGRIGLGQTSPATTVDINGAQSANIVAVAVLDIDCSLGNTFTKTINANSTFTVSNVPASRSYAFTLEVTHTSGIITWFSGVTWPGGTAPTLTTGKVHLFMFFTDDGGTTWRASSLINY